MNPSTKLAKVAAVVIKPGTRSMSSTANVWVDKNTKAICQGFTGKQVCLVLFWTLEERLLYYRWGSKSTTWSNDLIATLNFDSNLLVIMRIFWIVILFTLIPSILLTQHASFSPPILGNFPLDTSHWIRNQHGRWCHSRQGRSRTFGSPGL